MTTKEKHNAYMKAWYKRNPEKRKDHDIKAYAKFKRRYIANARKYRLANPEKHLAYAQKSRKNNPEAHMGYRLKYIYGISLEDYKKMLTDQNYACAVCCEIPPYKLSVEHDHKTGQVRGLVCQKCNVAIGFIEQANLLDKVNRYLARFH